MRHAQTARQLAALAATALAASPPRQPPPPLVVDINLPAYRLEVRDGDSTWSYRVAIGQRKYPTPRGRFAVREVTWNPRWVPPASDWARDERPRAPGPDNPMGRVKLRITDLVFVHGTPLEASLGHAASHACVRMANADAIALARRVLRRAAPEVTDAEIDALVADSTHTRTIGVRWPVPVTVRYELAEVRRDTLWAYPDVYAVRGASARADAMRALVGAGADTLRVRAVVLDSLLRASRRAVAGVLVGNVLRAVALPAPP
jgi:murein L,D-transpeptidase YcbB/YkuD